MPRPKKGERPPALVAATEARRGKRALKDELSDRERAVVDAYFGKARFNKNEACRQAGYADISGRGVTALFRRPRVAAEIERRHEKNRRRYEATYDRIIEELSSVAFSNLADVMEFDEETGALVGMNLTDRDMRTLAAIGEVTVETYYEGRGAEAQPVRRVKVKPWNKLQALDMLVRHMGLSKEKTVVEHHVTITDRLAAGRERVRLHRSTEDREAASARRQLAEVVDAEFEEVDESRDSPSSPRDGQLPAGAGGSQEVTDDA